MRKIGYHSTSEEQGMKYCPKNIFESSEKNWLGKGIYFWGSSDICNGFDEAQWWAVNIKIY